MPYNTKHQLFTIEGMIAQAEKRIYSPISDLNIEVFVTPEPVPYDCRMQGEKKILRKGEFWGKVWDCGWFHFIGTVPESARGEKIVLYIDVHGELCVFNQAGEAVQGLTSGSSSMDPNCGSPKKREFLITESAVGGEKIDVWADAGCNDLFGVYPDVGKIEFADICVCREDIKGLYYDAMTLRGLMRELPESSARYCKIMQALFDAANMVWDFTPAEVEKARAALAGELNKRGGDSSLRINAIGHAHIDLAWLWPLRETKRKGVRTFSTVIRNMERYPEYMFGASQPQLYQWVKEEQPALYEQVRRKIAEDRWEVQGAMWVEADTNITGGEALIRQILYGKRFFRQEFGKEMEILWLPDVFGYSGALPQILKKSGVPYFLTIKLSWNQHNRHPHHTFLWHGIDDSEILVHMPPEGEYNSPATPKSVKKIERNFLDKNLCGEAMMLFGIGDGGGGPGESHLEYLKREENLEGLIPVSQGHAVEFFHRLERERERLQIFKGELYLEKHQGTYTSQARNKRYNRKMEYLLREVEFAAVAAGTEYPAQALEEIWKEILLYQFHDILPGSSIQRVYRESLERYAELWEKAEKLLADSYGEGTRVINSLSWERSEWIKRQDNWYHVRVPAMGSAELGEAVPSAVRRLDDCKELENDCVRVAFAEDGSVLSVFDKKNNREVIQRPSNRFAVYYDDGDAWDFKETYRERAPRYFVLESAEAFGDGPVKWVRQRYVFGGSVIEQEILITEGSARVDFRTKADWRERGKMLRTAFYTDIVTNEVTCDIQFGYVKRPTHRNTDWDAAKTEICAHKYLDLSDSGYGVALLNDCKYGFCVKEGMMDINLLRSTSAPGEEADMAEHEFAYALYPHKDDLAHSDVIRQSYAFNIPLSVGAADIVPSVRLSNPDIVVETVKKAEDSDAVILRLYESKGKCAETALEFDYPVKSVTLVDMMEENEQPVCVRQLKFRAFEIHTVKVERA